MRALGPGIALVSLAVLPGLARAGDGVEPVRVRFEEKIECSDEGRFFEEIRARTPRVRLAGPGDHARVFRVRVVNGESGVAGSVSTDDGGVVSAPRAIEAATCEEAVAALAFIAALSVDPAASLHAEPARPPKPAGPSGEPSTPTATIPAVPSSIALEPPRPPAETRPPPSASTNRNRPSAYVVALGAGPTAGGPDAPSTGLGGRAFVEVGRRAGLAPSVRLSFDLPSEQRRAVDAGVATFTWTRGAVDVCPIRVRLADDLSMAPCGGVEAGVLDGSGSRITDARSSRQPWVAGAAEARLRYDVFRFAFAEIDAGVTVPFVRQEFVFLPSPTVYQAPPAFLRGLVAAGVRFP